MSRVALGDCNVSILSLRGKLQPFHYFLSVSSLSVTYAHTIRLFSVIVGMLILEGFELLSSMLWLDPGRVVPYFSCHLCFIHHRLGLE